MAIVTLPLTYQMANGQTADASQVMADLNQIATNVNANAAPLDSAAFINTPTSTTPPNGDNSTRIATTAYVSNNFAARGANSDITSLTGITGIIKFASGVSIASAATVNLSTATGNTVHITGTTAITAFTMASGQVMQVIFDGALVLTHHATNNNLPGASNITTVAGDRAWYYYDGTTVYCLNYVKASYAPYPAIGAGQSLQDVTASRALSTTYTNSTGRTILVMVVASNSIAATFGGSVNSATVIQESRQNGFYATLIMIVPPGGTYSAAWNAGTPTVATWYELR